MKTVANIFNSIQGLNENIDYVSGLGNYVSTTAQIVKEETYKSVIASLPDDSLAYKIITSTEHFSVKQLWIIAYSLENTEYAAKVDEEARLENARRNSKLNKSNDKISANKAATQDVLDYVKSNGKKLGDYYKFLHDSKSFKKEYYSKKYTMTSANEFLNIK